MTAMGMVRKVALTVWVCGLTGQAGAVSWAADAYGSIVDRNAFGLKDPPPAVVKPEPPHTNDVRKEEFYLTGISTIGNPKKPKAYLLAKDNSKKEYNEKFFNLSVGDRQGDVELREIDEKGRRVRIVYQGEEKWLSMKDNGVPAPVGVAPSHPSTPGMPGIPGQPAAAPALPGTQSVPAGGHNPGGTYAMPQLQPQPLTSASTPNVPATRRIPRSSLTPGANSASNPTTPPQIPPLPLPAAPQ